nr:MAG TPA: hypothetical protein [Caudoviricetes sp.]
MTSACSSDVRSLTMSSMYCIGSGSGGGSVRAIAVFIFCSSPFYFLRGSFPIYLLGGPAALCNKRRGL